MADYEIEVEVGPDTTGFTRDVERELAAAERRIDPVQVQVEAEVPARFARELDRELKRALARVEANVPVDAKVSKAFRRNLQREITGEMRARPLEVPATITLARSWRSDLRRELATVGREANLAIPVKLTIARNFRGEFSREIQTVGKANDFEVPVGLTLRAGWHAALQREITAGTAARPLSASVAPEVSARGLVAYTSSLQTKARQAAAAVSASGAADISPGVDGTRMNAEMVAFSKQAAISASAVSSIPVGVNSKKATKDVDKLARYTKIAMGAAFVGGALALGGVIAAFASAASTTADFEEQLSALNSVSEVSSRQLAQLREEALKAGAASTFTATEAALAQTELVKAGASFEQVTSGGLDAALALAAASGVELGDAATYVATGLNTFALEGDEAGRVADVLAAAANKSAADIPDMGIALQQAGLVANQFGLSIEDTAGALALFAQNGLSGSDAGTSLKTMLLRLNPTSKKARDAMEAVGFSAYDAQGNFIGLEAVAENLQNSLAGMTEEQRTAALTTMFGQDAIRGANLLYKEGGEGIEYWVDQLKESGYAQDVASERLDNLKGDLEALSGAWETSIIEAGTGAQSGLRDLVQSLVPIVETLGPKLADLFGPLAMVLTGISPLLGPLIDALLPLFENIVIAAAPLMEVFAELATVFAEIAGEVVEALVPAFEAFADPELVDALIELARAFAEVLVAVLPLLPALIELLVPVVTLAAEVLAFEPVVIALSAALTGWLIFSTLAAIIPPVIGAMASLGVISTGTAAAVLSALAPIALVVAVVAAVAAGFYLAYQKITPFRDAVDAVGRFLRDEVLPALQDFGAWLRDVVLPAVVDVGKAVGRWLVSAFEKVSDVFAAVWPVAKRLFTIFARVQFGPVVKLAQALGKLFTGDWSGFVDGIKDALLEVPRALSELPSVVGPVLASFGSWLLTSAVPKLVELGGKLGGALLSWVAGMGGKLISGLGQAMVALGTWIVTSAVPGLASAVAQFVPAFLGWIAQTLVTLPFRLAALLAQIVAWVIGASVILTVEAAKLGHAFLMWIAETLVALPGQLFRLLGAIIGWIGQVAPQIAAKVGELATAFLRWAGQVMTEMPGKMAEIATSIADWLSGIPGLITELIPKVVNAATQVGSAILRGIGDGIKAAASFVGDVASAIWEGIKGFINDNLIDPIREFHVNIDPPGPGKLYEGNPFGSFPRLAEGGLVKIPTLAMIGEAGPELVLPLTDKKRMLELLAEAGVADTLAAGGTPPAPSSLAAALPGPAATEGPAEAPGAGVQPYVDAAVEIMATFPQRVRDATVPGLIAWRVELQAVVWTPLARDFSTTLERMRIAAVTWTTVSLPTATLPGLTSWRLRMAAQFALFSNETQNAFTVTTTAVQSMWSTFLASMTSAATVGGRAIVDALVEQLSAGTAKIEFVVVGYRNELADALNPILEAVGERRLRFAAGGAVERFARGGYVPGPNVERDVVPALLMPGEFVLTKQVTDRLGASALAALNSGRTPSGWRVPGYAEGGQVTGDVQGLHPEFVRRLGQFSAAVGQTYHVGSGYRSVAEQARLYQLYLAGKGNKAAPPGSSMHNFGLASDGNHWSSRGPGRFGLAYTVAGEPWHIEPNEARQWRAAMPDGGAGGWGALAGLQPLPKPPKAGDGSLAMVAEALMGWTYDKALAWAQSASFGDPSGDFETAGAGSAGAKRAGAWIRQAMAATGVPDSWFSGLMTIARRESNFDPKAINLWDSNAAKGQASRGMFQTIPSTFRAHALPGWGDIYNPVHNAAAAIRYILARYGDISRVQQANPNRPPKGYAAGGLVEALTSSHRMGDLAALTRPAGGFGSTSTTRNGVVVQDGGVRIEVAAPSSHDPESYAMALGHRLTPVLAAVAQRAG